MDKDLLTVKKIAEEYKDFSEQKLTFLVREKRLKAKKIGNKYYITRADWNEFIGLTASTESIDKDLEIARLKSELAIKTNTINTLKRLLQTANSIIV